MYAAAATERMEALDWNGKSATELAQLALTSLRTARRWMRTGLAPSLVVRWLKLRRTYQLELIHPDWEGWTLRHDGFLHSPEGFRFRPNELRTVPLMHQQISAQRDERADNRREIRQLQAEIQHMQQPLVSRADLNEATRLLMRLQSLLLPKPAGNVEHQPRSLKRRHSDNATTPMADTISPTMTPSAIREPENFTAGVS